MLKLFPQSRVLLTGCSGFIGFWLSKALLEKGVIVLGIDCQKQSLYKDIFLERLNGLKKYPNFHFLEHDLGETALKLPSEFEDVEYLFHLAARGGVRRSSEHPLEFVHNNIRAHQYVLELCLQLKNLKHFFYASSSSVYGDRQKDGDFKETDKLGRSMSLYAMTKVIAEQLTSRVIPRAKFFSTGLRFFTVYGPLGRPDMACGLFLNAIKNQKPISLWEGEELSRDFTYVEDVVAALLALAQSDKEREQHEIVNVGCHSPRTVRDLVHLIEEELGAKALVEIKERPATELMYTKADISKLQHMTDWKPQYLLEEGVHLTCNHQH